MALVALPMFTVCASIVNGPAQNINIAAHDSKTLEPISAKCTVSNGEGSTTVVTPTSVSLLCNRTEVYKNFNQPDRDVSVYFV